MDWWYLKLCAIFWMFCTTECQTTESQTTDINDIEINCTDDQRIPPPDACNICTCLDGTKYCTNSICDDKNNNSISAKLCTNETYVPKLDMCNQCICLEGRVACTDLLCVKMSGCVNGLKYPGKDACNKCVCKDGYVVCTNNVCDKNITDTNSTACEDGKEIPSTSDCEECSCIAGQIQCNNTCDLTSALRARPEIGSGCVSGQAIPKPDDCNNCICFQGEIHCTHLPCNSGILAPVCSEEQSLYKPDECNECHCSNGRLECSNLICIRGSNCTAEEEIPNPDSCNTCFCVEGHILCTNYKCPVVESRFMSSEEPINPVLEEIPEQCHEGDKIPQPDDGKTCTCQNGRITCSLGGSTGSATEVIVNPVLEEIPETCQEGDEIPQLDDGKTCTCENGRITCSLDESTVKTIDLKPKNANEDNTKELLSFDKQISVDPLINMLYKKRVKAPSKLVHTHAYNGFRQEIKVRATNLPKETSELIHALAESMNNSVLSDLSDKIKQSNFTGSEPKSYISTVDQSSLLKLPKQKVNGDKPKKQLDSSQIEVRHAVSSLITSGSHTNETVIVIPASEEEDPPVMLPMLLPVSDTKYKVIKPYKSDSRNVTFQEVEQGLLFRNSSDTPTSTNPEIEGRFDSTNIPQQSPDLDTHDNSVASDEVSNITLTPGEDSSSDVDHTNSQKLSWTKYGTPLNELNIVSHKPVLEPTESEKEKSADLATLISLTPAHGFQIETDQSRPHPHKMKYTTNIQLTPEQSQNMTLITGSEELKPDAGWVGTHTVQLNNPSHGDVLSTHKTNPPFYKSKYNIDNPQNRFGMKMTVINENTYPTLSWIKHGGSINPAVPIQYNNYILPDHLLTKQMIKPHQFPIITNFEGPSSYEYITKLNLNPASPQLIANLPEFLFKSDHNILNNQIMSHTLSKRPGHTLGLGYQAPFNEHQLLNVASVHKVPGHHPKGQAWLQSNEIIPTISMTNLKYPQARWVTPQPSPYPPLIPSPSLNFDYLHPAVSYDIKSLHNPSKTLIQSITTGTGGSKYYPSQINSKLHTKNTIVNLLSPQLNPFIKKEIHISPELTFTDHVNTALVSNPHNVFPMGIQTEQIMGDRYNDGHTVNVKGHGDKKLLSHEYKMTQTTVPTNDTQTGVLNYRFTDDGIHVSAENIPEEFSVPTMFLDTDHKLKQVPNYHKPETIGGCESSYTNSHGFAVNPSISEINYHNPSKIKVINHHNHPKIQYGLQATRPSIQFPVKPSLSGKSSISNTLHHKHPSNLKHENESGPGISPKFGSGTAGKPVTPNSYQVVPQITSKMSSPEPELLTDDELADTVPNISNSEENLTIMTHPKPVQLEIPLQSEKDKLIKNIGYNHIPNVVYDSEMTFKSPQRPLLLNFPNMALGDNQNPLQKHVNVIENHHHSIPNNYKLSYQVQHHKKPTTNLHGGGSLSVMNIPQQQQKISLIQFQNYPQSGSQDAKNKDQRPDMQTHYEESQPATEIHSDTYKTAADQNIQPQLYNSPDQETKMTISSSNVMPDNHTDHQLLTNETETLHDRFASDTPQFNLADSSKNMTPKTKLNSQHHSQFLLESSNDLVSPDLHFKLYPKTEQNNSVFMFGQNGHQNTIAKKKLKHENLDQHLVGFANYQNIPSSDFQFDLQPKVTQNESVVFFGLTGNEIAVPKAKLNPEHHHQYLIESSYGQHPSPLLQFNLQPTSEQNKSVLISGQNGIPKTISNTEFMSEMHTPDFQFDLQPKITQNETVNIFEPSGHQNTITKNKLKHENLAQYLIEDQNIPSDFQFDLQPKVTQNETVVLFGNQNTSPKTEFTPELLSPDFQYDFQPKVTHNETVVMVGQKGIQNIIPNNEFEPEQHSPDFQLDLLPKFTQNETGIMFGPKGIQNTIPSTQFKSELYSPNFQFDHQPAYVHNKTVTMFGPNGIQNTIPSTQFKSELYSPNFQFDHQPAYVHNKTVTMFGPNGIQNTISNIKFKPELHSLNFQFEHQPQYAQNETVIMFGPKGTQNTKFKPELHSPKVKFEHQPQHAHNETAIMFGPNGIQNILPNTEYKAKHHPPGFQFDHQPQFTQNNTVKMLGPNGIHKTISNTKFKPGLHSPSFHFEHQLKYPQNENVLLFGSNGIHKTISNTEYKPEKHTPDFQLDLLPKFTQNETGIMFGSHGIQQTIPNVKLKHDKLAQYFVDNQNIPSDFQFYLQPKVTQNETLVLAGTTGNEITIPKGQLNPEHHLQYSIESSYNQQSPNHQFNLQSKSEQNKNALIFGSSDKPTTFQKTEYKPENNSKYAQNEIFTTFGAHGHQNTIQNNKLQHNNLSQYLMELFSDDEDIPLDFQFDVQPEFTQNKNVIMFGPDGHHHTIPTTELKHENFTQYSVEFDNGQQLPSDFQFELQPKFANNETVVMFGPNGVQNTIPDYTLKHDNLTKHLIELFADDQDKPDFQFDVTPELVQNETVILFGPNGHQITMPITELKHENLTQYSFEFDNGQQLPLDLQFELQPKFANNDTIIIFEPDDNQVSEPPLILEEDQDKVAVHPKLSENGHPTDAPPCSKDSINNNFDLVSKTAQLTLPDNRYKQIIIDKATLFPLDVLNTDSVEYNSIHPQPLSEEEIESITKLTTINVPDSNNFDVVPKSAQLPPPDFTYEQINVILNGGSYILKPESSTETETDSIIELTTGNILDNDNFDVVPKSAQLPPPDFTYGQMNVILNGDSDILTTESSTDTETDSTIKLTTENVLDSDNLDVVPKTAKLLPPDNIYEKVVNDKNILFPFDIDLNSKIDSQSINYTTIIHILNNTDYFIDYLLSSKPNEKFSSAENEELTKIIELLLQHADSEEDLDLPGEVTDNGEPVNEQFESFPNRLSEQLPPVNNSKENETIPGIKIIKDEKDLNITIQNLVLDLLKQYQNTTKCSLKVAVDESDKETKIVSSPEESVFYLNITHTTEHPQETDTPEMNSRVKETSNPDSPDKPIHPSTPNSSLQLEYSEDTELMNYALNSEHEKTIIKLCDQPKNSHYVSNIQSLLLPKLLHSRFRHKSKDGKDECGEGSEWIRNCHGCACINGQADCYRIPNCILRPFGELMICKPYSQFKMGDCYSCICNGDGIAECDATECLRNSTSEGNKDSNDTRFTEFYDGNQTKILLNYYDLFKKLPKDQIYPTCEAGTTWISNCHNCVCKENGKHECTRTESCELDYQMYGKPSRCKPNSKFYPKSTAVPCVECTCDDEGNPVCPAT